MLYEDFLAAYESKIEEDSSLSPQSKLELAILFQSLSNEVIFEYPSPQDLLGEIQLISEAQAILRSTPKSHYGSLNEVGLKLLGSRLTQIGNKLITTDEDNSETKHQKYLAYLEIIKIHDEVGKAGDNPIEELSRTSQISFARHQATEAKTRELANIKNPDEKEEKRIELIATYKREVKAIEDELAAIPPNFSSLSSKNPTLIIGIRKQIRTERINFLNERKEFLEERISPKKTTPQQPTTGPKIRGRSKLSQQQNMEDGIRAFAGQS